MCTGLSQLCDFCDFFLKSGNFGEQAISNQDRRHYVGKIPKNSAPNFSDYGASDKYSN